MPSHDQPRPLAERPSQPWFLSLFKLAVGLLAAALVIGALLVGYGLLVMQPRLPSLDAITDYRPKVPLRVYTADHVLIGEFGEERRSLVRFADIPDIMKKAVLSIEDYRFYEHGGVDFVGILRAGVADLTHGGASQGASTITMQVARNFFLSSEKTYTRKIYEMMLAYKIESALSKDQILELYMNQIYLGQRAYGFAAAARVYFGRDLKDVTLAQAAMLAGLPKAPSAYNPIVNPKRARIRQVYILKRMLDLGYITPDQFEQASHEDLRVRGSGNEFSVHAEYVAEMARQMMYAQYRDETYTRGLSVTTTIDSADQESAYQAVRRGVMDYERRHGYRGPEAFIELPADQDDRDDAIADVLVSHPDSGDLLAAVVTAASPRQLDVQTASGAKLRIAGDGLRFVASALGPRASAALRIRPGAVIRLMPGAKDDWQVTQLPQVEGALVSLSPRDGAVRSLVGGFDYNKNKFNHVTQAWRQPGSTFKPFIYSASIEKGLGPATLINDAPLSFPPQGPGQDPWEPKDDDQPQGIVTMRDALAKSKNLVSIRILNFIGTGYARDFVTRTFGFDPEHTPAYLPLALGAGVVTPLQLAGGYAVFANGGYRIDPYLIAEVVDSRGQPLSRAQPLVAGQNAPRTLDARNAYIVTSLLRTVAQRGTAAATNAMRRSDIVGKTGTTNEARDGWFAGYQHDIVAVAWMGYDQPRTLGSREFGAQLALPIWMQYMSRALRGLPQVPYEAPPGIVAIGGEPYLDNLTPGNGFVASVEPLDAPGEPGASSGVDGAGTPNAAVLQGNGIMPAPPSAGEKDQILNMFQNKP
jgi:penicillin-binding protein 1A